MTRPYRILVGVDGSTNSQSALEWAIWFAGRVGAEVIAVHAIGLLAELGEGDPVPSESHMDQIRLTFETRWCWPLVTSGLPYRLYAQEGPPVMVLRRAADEAGIDLVVVGRRGTGSSPELLLGSTSHQLVEQSTVPVVVIPPPDRFQQPAPKPPVS